MKSAALQLRRYFVTELNVTASRQHEPDKPIKLTDENLVVKQDFLPQKDDPRRWQVTLRIQQQSGPTTNSPYSFTIELVGYFAVANNYPELKSEWMVRTNAVSVLYSTAREVLRGVMSQGPFCPLLLPIVSFYTPEIKRMLDDANASLGKQKALPKAKTTQRGESVPP
jgi:preprotein translocase subunit SecB